MPNLVKFYLLWLQLTSQEVPLSILDQLISKLWSKTISNMEHYGFLFSPKTVYFQEMGTFLGPGSLGTTG